MQTLEVVIGYTNLSYMFSTSSYKPINVIQKLSIDNILYDIFYLVFLLQHVMHFRCYCVVEFRFQLTNISFCGLRRQSNFIFVIYHSHHRLLTQSVSKMNIQLVRF